MNEDNSIVRFKTFLKYKTQNGILVGSIGNITFTITVGGMRYHLTVTRNGKTRVIGNYRILDWAKYEAPYFWWMKNIGQISDIPKLFP
jgi:hypothetical protein